MAELEIFPATELDNTELLRPVLESAIRNPFTQEVIWEEIEEDLELLEASRLGNSQRYYAVACTSGSMVVGMMGLQSPEQPMRDFATTDNPIEIVNAYVLQSSRGLGVGQALVQHLENKAKAEGYTEILLNSGPRYRFSGWPFWRRMYGPPVGKINDYYGLNFHAMVWRNSLAEEK